MRQLLLPFRMSNHQRTGDLMKRRQFLKFQLVATAMASAIPTVANVTAGNLPLQSPKEGLLVKAGVDRDDMPFKFLDATFYVKVSGKDNDGRCVIFDTLRPEKVGPRLHTHEDCDEWFFVRDGEFKFQVGNDIMRLKAGDSLLVHRDTPHAFVKTSEGVARLIVMHQPAGTMEEYFRTVLQQADQSLEGRRAFGEKHGMRLVGEALKPD